MLLTLAFPISCKGELALFTLFCIQGRSQQERGPTRKLGILSRRPAVQVGLAELLGTFVGQ